jgi:hypothetical protein
MDHKGRIEECQNSKTGDSFLNTNPQDTSCNNLDLDISTYGNADRIDFSWQHRRDSGGWRRTRGCGWIEKEMKNAHKNDCLEIKRGENNGWCIYSSEFVHYLVTINRKKEESQLAKLTQVGAGLSGWKLVIRTSTSIYARRPDQWYSRLRTAKGLSS